MPRERGIKPSYEERALPGFDQAGKLMLVASPEGAEGSTTINANARLYAAKLKAGQKVDYDLPQSHGAWVQVTRGRVALNGETLDTADGAAVEGLKELRIEAGTDAEILLFDLE
jgi:hypothetical protein